MSRSHGRVVRLGLAMTVAGLAGAPMSSSGLAHAGGPPALGSTLAGRAVVLDKEGKLLSWVEPQDQAYASVGRLAWEQLLTGFPVESNGLPTWLAYCCFDGETLHGTAWPHNPASTYAGLVQGAATWRAFSGDERVVAFVRRILDHQLANGTTPADPDWAWPSVPYASADHGAVRYRGAHDFRYAEKDDPRPRLGRGDGHGVVEPDKVGRARHRVSHGLEAHQRPPLPRCRPRVRPGARRARPGGRPRVSRGRFAWWRRPASFARNTAPTWRPRFGCSTGSTARDRRRAEWHRARRIAWAWLEADASGTTSGPTTSRTCPGCRSPTNLNQFDPGELARYLLEHPDRDPEWRDHAGHLITGSSAPSAETRRRSRASSGGR